MGNLKDIAPGLYMMAAVLGGGRDEEHVEKSLKRGVANYLERLGTPPIVIESLIALTKKSNSNQGHVVKPYMTIVA
jgi:hypothetical protein